MSNCLESCAIVRICKRLSTYRAKSLSIVIGIVMSHAVSAGAQVARPDEAGVAVVERANETRQPAQAFEKLETKAGNWRVENEVLTQADAEAPYARAFIRGPRWLDCVIKAKVRVDRVGASAASPGARLIVRGDESTDTFYTVGLWAGSHEVRIEKSRGLAFEPMKSDHLGNLAVAPFPVELGKTYEMTVVADHAAIYCYIDGNLWCSRKKRISLPSRLAGWVSSRMRRRAHSVTFPSRDSTALRRRRSHRTRGIR